MKPRPLEDCTELMDSLKGSCGAGKKEALMLQNYFTYCNCTSAKIDSAADSADTDGVMLIATRSCPTEKVAEMAASIGSRKATLCILTRSADRSLKEFVGNLVAGHDSMSISNRYFTMLFYNELRPKQHINL